jgi:PAS domain S-box-containing protein
MSDRTFAESAELAFEILEADPDASDRRLAGLTLTDDDREALRDLHSALGVHWPALVDALLEHLATLPGATGPGADTDTLMVRQRLLDHLGDLAHADFDAPYVLERIRDALDLRAAGTTAETMLAAVTWITQAALPFCIEAAAGDAGRAARWSTAFVKALAFDLSTGLETLRSCDVRVLESQRRFTDLLIETLPDGVLLVAADGTVRTFNRAAEEIFRVRRAQAIGHPLAERLHEYHLHEVATLLRSAFGARSTGKAEDAGRATVQLTALLGDGETLPVELAMRAAQHDGEWLCCVAVRDVGERVRAQQALRRSEANFRALIEGSPEAITVHRGGQIVYANPGFVRLLGATDWRHMVGQPLADFVDPSDRRLLFPGPEDNVEPPRPGGRELRFRRLDGTPVVVDAIDFVLEFDGKPAIVLVAHDLTERKQLTRRMMEMDNAIAAGDLAATISHDINNPLTYVLGNAQFGRLELRRLSTMLRDPGRALAGTGLESSPALDDIAARLEEIAHALDEVHEGAGRIRETVASLRGVAHSSEDDSTQTTHVERAVDAAVNVLFNDIRHRARFERQYLEIPPVRVSERRLCQVFLHLLQNAAQSIPEGESETNEIRVRTYASAGRVHIDLSDTGQGMSEDQLARAFEPFYTTRKGVRATGLGLTICREILQSMGGTITLQSEPGYGTTVRISLPAAESVEDARRRTGPIRHGLPALRILLVDDEPLVASALRRTLDRDHEVVTLTRARDALDRIEAGEWFDAIFCDLQMPAMSGMAFHAELTNACPSLADRVVFITGGAFTPGARAFLSQVRNACIDKPFDMVRVNDALSRVIQGDARQVCKR